MLTILTMLAFLALGSEAARRWLPAQPQARIERAAAALLLSITAWVSSSWILALLHLLTRPALIVRIVVMAAVAAALWATRPRPVPTARVHFDRCLFLFLPVLLWIVFVLWTGWVVPPLSHDALAYHLPKAVLFSRAHGFEYLGQFTDWRLRDLPVNYELLLTDIITMEGNDRITEWPSAVFYVALLVVTAALVARWWGELRGAVLTTILFVASIPVLLLHAGAIKNDVMTAVFMLSVLVWGGRWFSEGDLRALALAIIAGALGIGTKPQAAPLLVCVAPFLVWRMVRELRLRPGTGRRAIAIAGFLSIAAFALLGGVSYVSTFLHRADAVQTQDPVETRYGSWPAFWQSPYVLLAAPFSPSDFQLVVPWQRQAWFWRRYELYFSHLGAPFVVCVFLFPVAIVAGRKIDRGRRERAVMMAAAFGALLLLFPVDFTPHGFYTISLPRYALFFSAAIFAAVVPPVVDLVRQRWPRWEAVPGVLASIVFTWNAIDYGTNNAFVPLRYVLWAAQHPGTRIVPFTTRAGNVVDSRAGPYDRIAIDPGYDTWLQPLFGAALTRTVEFIPAGVGPPRISDAAKWVVVDRSFNIHWHHPAFKDLSQSELVSHGYPTADDLRVVNYLRRDPAFRLVWENRATNQAVFARTPGRYVP